VNDDEKRRIEQVALFRFGVLGDLVHLTPGHKGIAKQLAEKAARDYLIPYSDRTRIAAETIRDWLKSHRQGGFEALLPKPRSDRGASRTIPQEVADLLVAIKEEHPDWSLKLVVQEAKARGLPEGVRLKPTTVHRLMTRHGLMERQEPADPHDRRRFAFQKAGELWMSDVMHGPTVLVGKTRRKTYLIAFLDDATRVVPYAAFALSENVATFLPVFKQAVLRRGVPKRLLVDNGSAYRSQHLSLVCARLGTTLIHARPYQPQSKGKQERFFRRVRTQLLPTLTQEDSQSLEALNRRLWGWVETEYHCSPHKGLDGQTPFDRWAQSADEVRYLDSELEELFLAEARRKVQKDRIVSLDGKAYEVDASLVGQTVVLRFDPSLPGRSIQIHADGKRWEAKLVDTYANCFVKRDRPSQLLTPGTPPKTPAPEVATPEKPLAPSTLNLAELAARKQEDR
jgi:transposase InsO family protein